MGLFKKKKKDLQTPDDIMGGIGAPGVMQGNPAINQVKDMQSRGLSNNQIMQELQNKGIPSNQIFDALNMAEPTNIAAGPIGAPPSQNMDMPESGMGGINDQMADTGLDMTKERIEEMAEAIIDEKWEELVKSINKIIEWKDKVESNVYKIEQEIKDLKENFNNLHSSIVGKINEYDKNIVDVGTEIKAMEKVFQKVLPTFSENISDLKRVVQDIKKK